MFVLNVVLILWSMFGVCTEGSLWKAFLHAIFRAILVVQTTHAASHFSLSLNPMVNRWAYRVGTILIGLWSPKNWDTQHVVAHHVYTNEWPFDSDSAFPIKSILYNQRRFWYHKYQHIYMGLLFPLLFITKHISDYKAIITHHTKAVDMMGATSRDFFLAHLAKILHFGITLGLPMYLHGTSAVLFPSAFVFFFLFLINPPFFNPTIQFQIGPYLLHGAIGSSVLAWLFAISHNLEDTKHDTDFVEGEFSRPHFRQYPFP